MSWTGSLNTGQAGQASESIDMKKDQTLQTAPRKNEYMHIDPY